MSKTSTFSKTLGVVGEVLSMALTATSAAIREHETQFLIHRDLTEEEIEQKLRKLTYYYKGGLMQSVKTKEVVAIQSFSILPDVELTTSSTMYEQFNKMLVNVVEYDTAANKHKNQIIRSYPAYRFFNVDFTIYRDEKGSK